VSEEEDIDREERGDAYHAAQEHKRPGHERRGPRPKRKERTPAEFAAAVLDEHRRSLVTGYLGIRCSRAGLLASLRFVSLASGTPCQRPGLPLPRALRHLSAPTQRALDRASFTGFENLSQTNLDPSALATAERLALLLAALRIYRHRAGLMHRDHKPEKIVSAGDPVEQELCQELSSALATWPVLINATDRELAAPSQTSLAGGTDHAQAQRLKEQEDHRKGSGSRAQGSGGRRKRAA
jgi:hypothetical protein